MSDDLTKQEADLKREQAAWRTEKVELQRDIAKLRAEKALFGNELEKPRQDLQVLLEEVQAKVQDLQGLRVTENELRTKIYRLGQDKDQLLAEKEALQAEIETRRQAVDVELENLANDRRKTLTAGLTSLEGDIVVAQSDLEDILETVGLQKNILANLKDQTERAAIDLSAANERLADQKLATRSVISEAVARQEAALARLDELLKENERLVTDNKKIADANQQFRNYETKAWKILNAKDEELLAREVHLEEREQFRPSRKSFLPPTEE